MNLAGVLLLLTAPAVIAGASVDIVASAFIQGAVTLGRAAATSAAVGNSNATTLSFGVVSPAVAGTVTLNPRNGVRQGSPALLARSGLSHHLAGFQVTSSPGARLVYAICLPAAVLVANGPDTMKVDAFTVSVISDTALGTVQSGLRTGVLNEHGAQRFNVGATLTVPPGAKAGNYTGSFDAAVVYQ